MIQTHLSFRKYSFILSKHIFKKMIKITREMLKEHNHQYTHHSFVWMSTISAFVHDPHTLSHLYCWIQCRQLL